MRGLNKPVIGKSERGIDMDDERLSVEFTSEMSKNDNCMCDCCHGLGKVLKLKLPRTEYFNGKKLSTEYRNFWICDDCRMKLNEALRGDEQ